MQPDKLIVELQSGNERAFERIYHLYSRSIHGVIFNIVRDETICDEVLQDVFLKIWNHASSYDANKGRFFTWILNIARNASIDKIRSKDFKKRHSDLTGDYFESELNIQSDSGKIDAIGLQKYINILGPTCRKLIDLLFFRGFTQKESAEELKIPLGTVKTKNKACIDKLRASLIKS